MAYTVKDIRAEFDRLDAKYGFNTTNIIFQVSKYRPKRWARYQWWSRTGREVCLFFVEVLNSNEEKFYNTIRQMYGRAVCNRIFHTDTGHDVRYRAVCRVLGCTADRIQLDTTMFTYDQNNPYIGDIPLTEDNFVDKQNGTMVEVYKARSKEFKSLQSFEDWLNAHKDHPNFEVAKKFFNFPLDE